MSTGFVSLADLPPPPAGRSGWPWTVASVPASAALASGRPCPTISIVTPSYNQGTFIEETIRSVLLQGYPSLQYIIMDGGSSDETLDVIRKYEAWLHWVSEPDGGQTDAINKGLRLATGELRAYLNSDDTYLPGSLHAIAGFMTVHPEYGLAYGDCEVVDEGGKSLGYLPRHPFNLKRTIERGEFVPQQAAFWRLSVQNQVGMLDDRLHFAMDYEFFIRIATFAPVGYLPQPLAAFRMHGSSKTVSQSDRHWREALAVSERHGLRPYMPWYWLRRLRHHGLRSLPGFLQSRVRQRLARPYDPLLSRR